MTTTLNTECTPLYATHKEMGAKIVDFHGWMMPLQYNKVADEHHAVRNHAGLFDISHMGLITLKGNIDSITSTIEKLSPQRIATLPEGKAVYTQFLNDQGGVIDDLIIYRLSESTTQLFQPCKFWVDASYLIICNASNRSVILNWLRQHLPAQVEVHLASEHYGLLALQGPNAQTVISNLGISTLPKRFWIAPAQIENIPILVSRTGYTGEDGVEIIVPNPALTTIWQKLLDKGQAQHILPCGLAARDTLRMEAAYPLYGQEFDETITPLEAGLAWSVVIDKETPYIGQEALQQQVKEGLTRQTLCLKLDAHVIPRHGFKVFYQGQEVGIVTSGGISPTLNCPIAIALCYIDKKALQNFVPGVTVQIEIRNKPIDATIVERPFYKPQKK